MSLEGISRETNKQNKTQHTKTYGILQKAILRGKVYRISHKQPNFTTQGTRKRRTH